jgi:hypothetical protein
MMAGCADYLGPYEDRPLPARSIPLADGGELALENGDVSLHTGRRDPGSALGVALEEDASGVVVTNRLRKDAELAPGDRILTVTATVPGGTDRAPVARIADLRGWLCGLGWLELELEVRRGEATVLVRTTPRDVIRRVPVELRHSAWDSEPVVALSWPALYGAEVCSLRDWPEELLPPGARRTESLVLRVAQCSSAGLAGLVPGDVVVEERVRHMGKKINRGRDLLHQLDSFVWDLRVRGVDGRERAIPIEHVRTSEEWIPGVMSYLSDGIRWHFGLGPFDLLYHSSSRPSFAEDSDVHERVERMSFLTIIQWDRTTRGAGPYVRSAFQPFIDLERAAYYKEWLDGVPHTKNWLH